MAFKRPERCPQEGCNRIVSTFFEPDQPRWMEGPGRWVECCPLGHQKQVLGTTVEEMNQTLAAREA